MTTEVPSLRTTVQRSGRSVVVCVVGELDLATVPAMRQALRDASCSGLADVVVDLAGVTFVDASGLSCLLQGAEALHEQGGELRLASPSRLLRRMLRLLDLERQLPVVRDGD